MEYEQPLLSRIQYKLDWFRRLMTAKDRCLPNCLIVGAQKAGTSSLYHYLTQHPQIHECFKKEVHYFDGGLDPEVDTYQRGENWYRAHFPLKKNMNKDDICLEASPLYLFNPLAAERIKSLLPDCKIIIILRNPVERAISHYFHVVRHGLESFPIEDALEKEENRLEHIWQNGSYSDPVFRLYSYKSRGLYLEQILRYQECFSKQNILVLSSDDLSSQPKHTLETIFNFLEINYDNQTYDFKLHNVGENKEYINSPVYQKLHSYFVQHNQELFKYLGKDIKW